VQDPSPVMHAAFRNNKVSCGGFNRKKVGAEG
jgi:hypothetical protein